MRHPAFHGGAFFDAIGVDLRHLERSGLVISADVLDAWFDPSPRVLEMLRQHLPFLPRQLWRRAEMVDFLKRVPAGTFPSGPLAGRFLRITVKDAAQNRRMVEVLHEISL